MANLQLSIMVKEHSHYDKYLPLTWEPPYRGGINNKKISLKRNLSRFMFIGLKKG